jgi:hypothetical protein
VPSVGEKPQRVKSGNDNDWQLTDRKKPLIFNDDDRIFSCDFLEWVEGACLCEAKRATIPLKTP